MQLTLEQIDVVKGMAERYPEDFAVGYTAADVCRILPRPRRCPGCVLGPSRGPRRYPQTG